MKSTNPIGEAQDRARFRTTEWTSVRIAGNASFSVAGIALEELCQRYWYPLYAFARRKGFSPEDSQDLTQGFFSVVLEKNGSAAADRCRGRFRTFLLAAFENFLRNEWARLRTLKRGGGVTFIAWQTEDPEDRYRHEPVDDKTPAYIFERRWALCVLDTAMERLRVEFSKAGKEQEFEVLEGFLTGEKHPLANGKAAERLGRSEGAVRVAVHRIRARYGELLRLAIAETLVDPQDLDDELRRLIAVLRA